LTPPACFVARLSLPSFRLSLPWAFLPPPRKPRRRNLARTLCACTSLCPSEASQIALALQASSLWLPNECCPSAAVTERIASSTHAAHLPRHTSVFAFLSLLRIPANTHNGLRTLSSTGRIDAGRTPHAPGRFYSMPASSDTVRERAPSLTRHRRSSSTSLLIWLRIHNQPLQWRHIQHRPPP
jgi:hypothetical protein